MTSFVSFRQYLCGRNAKNEQMSDNRPIPLTHRRCPGRNYSARGIYLITLCTEHRYPLLGELCGENKAQAHIRPSALGAAVLRCWGDIPAFHRGRAAQKSLRIGKECRREIQLISADYADSTAYPPPHSPTPLGEGLPRSSAMAERAIAADDRLCAG